MLQGMPGMPCCRKGARKSGLSPVGLRAAMLSASQEQSWLLAGAGGERRQGCRPAGGHRAATAAQRRWWLLGRAGAQHCAVRVSKYLSWHLLVIFLLVCFFLLLAKMSTN